MFIRIAVAVFSIMLLAGCGQEPGCKGLGEAECTANNACAWSAEKARCHRKKDDKSSQEPAPATEGTSPDAAPAPEPAPEPAPGDTPQ